MAEASASNRESHGSEAATEAQVDVWRQSAFRDRLRDVYAEVAEVEAAAKIGAP